MSMNEKIEEAYGGFQRLNVCNYNQAMVIALSGYLRAKSPSVGHVSYLNGLGTVSYFTPPVDADDGFGQRLGPVHDKSSSFCPSPY